MNMLALVYTRILSVLKSSAMPSRKFNSGPPHHHSRDRPGRPRMTPFTCFVRLHTAWACRDDEQVNRLQRIWDSFSDEERQPYETLASQSVPSGSSHAVTREASPENANRLHIAQEGAPDLYSREQNDPWGSIPTLVGDDSSADQISSQESITTLVDPDETSHIRTFGSFDEDNDTVSVPDDSQIASSSADNSRGTDFIWVHDPEALARLPGDKAGRSCL
ncbi:hypothetical protein ACEPAI_5707 [Sanghuangporus weigelae]